MTTLVAWLAALALWAVLRGWFALGATQGVGAAALLGAMIVALLVTHRATRAQRAALLAGCVGVGVVAALAGWVGLVWRIEPLAPRHGEPVARRGHAHLRERVGRLLAPLTLVAVAASVEHRHSRPGGTAAGIATCMLRTGLGATVSRGVGVAVIGAPSTIDAVARRATFASPYRVAQHAAAVAVVADHPIVGTGPGLGAVSRSDRDGTTVIARYVHDEYIQVTVELGLVGALLMAGARSTCS